jgi:hypothetical protein
VQIIRKKMMAMQRKTAAEETTSSCAGMAIEAGIMMAEAVGLPAATGAGVVTCRRA